MSSTGVRCSRCRRGRGYAEEESREGARPREALRQSPSSAVDEQQSPRKEQHASMMSEQEARKSFVRSKQQRSKSNSRVHQWKKRATAPAYSCSAHSRNRRVKLTAPSAGLLFTSTARHAYAAPMPLLTTHLTLQQAQQHLVGHTAPHVRTRTCCHPSTCRLLHLSPSPIRPSCPLRLSLLCCR